MQPSFRRTLRATATWWSAQRRGLRAAIVIFAAVLGATLTGSVLLVAGPGTSASGGAVLIVTPSPIAEAAEPAETATSAPTSTPTPTPTPTATPAASPTAEPTVETPAPIGSIEELTAQHGEPPDATLGRFRIPALGVDAPLGMRGVGDDGQMPNPAGPSDVVWYDFGSWDGFGGTIGGGSNAIFSGHVDYAAMVPYAGVAFRGRGVFFSLSLLSPGDIIEIDAAGETLRYAVQSRRQVAATDSGAWGEILSSEVEQDSITLITCGGLFNTAARSYLDRIVVRAVRI